MSRAVSLIEYFSYEATMSSNDDFEIDRDENEREDYDGPDHPFILLSANIERMISRRSGAYVHQSEEEDIMAIIDLYREWSANYVYSD